MEYIILWILALFGLWSLISNILDSMYVNNKVGVFDVILTVCNQEDVIQYLIEQLSKIDMIGKIKVIDNNSTDRTLDIVKNMKKSNNKIVIE